MMEKSEPVYETRDPVPLQVRGSEFALGGILKPFVCQDVSQ